MNPFPKAVNIKVEHNNSFSDHDYCFKEAAVYEMEEENRSLFVDVENDFENDDCNARGRKRRSVKPPEFYTASNTSSSGKMSKAKPKKSGGSSKKAKRGDEKKRKYEVEYIIGKRADSRRPNKFEYCVVWKGYPVGQSSWETEDNLRLCQESINSYEKSMGMKNGVSENAVMGMKNGVSENAVMEMKNGASEKGVKVVVLNGAKPLKHVLPTMQAPRLSSSVSSAVSIPSLPKAPKKATDSRKQPAEEVKAIKTNNKSDSKAEAVPKTIDALAEKLQGKVVVEILQHKSCDIDGVPFVFTTRYGDGSVKKVIMRDLLDIAPRELASYLAVALKRAEEGGGDVSA